jgi:hypothetical protein
MGTIASALHEHKRLVKSHTDHLANFKRRSAENELYKQAVDNNTDKSRRKELCRTLNEGQTSLNAYLHIHRKDVCKNFSHWMFCLERFKTNNKLPAELIEPVREAFIIMGNQSKTASRYRKLPLAWLELGAVGAFLEDLVVVMRTPNQVGIADQHLITMDEIIDGFRKQMDPDVYSDDEKDEPRFLFMNYAFSGMHIEELTKFIRMCIDSQGKSQRIGIYHDDDTDTDYYYAIQGIYGGIEFDKRVVTVLTPESFDDPTTPRYGVHFTKTNFALSIWNKESTKNGKAKGREILNGHIMRFDRVIHGLSCIEKHDNDYIISEEYAEIRNRMVHGITQMERPKYQAGLVLDIRKIVETLPPGSVMLNELGTLLVTESIPHECLLACLHTEEQVNKFWRVETPSLMTSLLYIGVPVVLSIFRYLYLRW